MRRFILFDGRAANGDTDEASVLVACETNEEALEARGEYGDMACYSYNLTQMPEGQHDQLDDERHEWNWYPGDPTTGDWPISGLRNDELRPEYDLDKLKPRE